MRSSRGSIRRVGNLRGERQLNLGNLKLLVARAHFDAEIEHLLQHGADIVIMGEREIARSMLQHAAGRAPAAS